jgi:hypothetical protein
LPKIYDADNFAFNRSNVDLDLVKSISMLRYGFDDCDGGDSISGPGIRIACLGVIHGDDGTDAYTRFSAFEKFNSS